MGLVQSLKDFGGRVKETLYSSKDSKSKMCMGAAQGVFWGLTPTVGIQITILLSLTAIILFLNRVFKDRLKFLEFNLPLAIVLTWISNPLDAPFLYFAFYAFGVFVLPGFESMGYQELQNLFIPLFKGEVGIIDFLESMGVQIVLPMIVGSFFIATFFSILSYIVVGKLLDKRAKNAST